LIVMKFGGTSVESAEAIARCASIVRDRLDRRPLVVVSAMGKTTNRLLEAGRTAAAGDRARALEQLAALRDFHIRESGAPEIAAEFFPELAELLHGLAILGELTPRALDAIASYGERLSSRIVAAHFARLGLPAVHVDARELIVTDARHTQAAPDFPETYARLARTLPPLLARHVVVMGGFIGATREGVTTTLGRGGSDYTAAIAGAGIGAGEIQIWTDVDGMLTADPRVFPGGRRVRVCSFNEAAELAYFGAKVLHPATVLPALERDIPVRILNSRRPEVEGTLLVADPPASRNAVKSIACKRDITVVNVVSTRMLGAHGFLRRIFEVFDRHETAVDMLATSEVSVSLTIDTVDRLAAIEAELRGFSEVTVERGQAIVCLVGDAIGATPGVAGRAFQAVRELNIRMISQGASARNIGFVVAGEAVARAVELLHHEFFADPDPAVFA
jgi:aspartate kinase